MHCRHRYAFEGLITELCHRAGVPTKDLDYCPRIEAPLYNVTNIKGLEESPSLVLTTVE